MRLMSYILAICFLCLAIFGQETCIESGWKGLKVFYTKRGEVERLLEKPFKDEGETIYRTKDAIVSIVFSETPCTNATFGRGAYSVEKNTIIQYQVDLLQSIPLSELKWNKSDYERYEDPHMLGLIHYGNPKANLSFTTRSDKNKVEQVGGFRFYATKQQLDDFRCKEK